MLPLLLLLLFLAVVVCVVVDVSFSSCGGSVAAVVDVLAADVAAADVV